MVAEGAALQQESEIRALTGLRFVAAFYVFLFHIHIRWPLAEGAFLRHVLDQGAIGMSLFFMLSGFLLAYRYADGQVSVKDYLLNRFARIYPVYAVAALVTLPWIGVGFGSGSTQDVARGLLQGLLLIGANLLLIQAWFPQFFSHWNNGGSWSISVEAFCYVLLPFLLPLLKALPLHRLRQTAALCLICAVLPGLSAALFPAASNPVYYSMPIFRLPEFLIGTCLMLAMRQGLVYCHGAGRQALVLAVFLLYLGGLGQAMPLYVGHNLVALPVIGFFIFSLSNGRGPIAAFLGSRLMVWLGKISYSFYSFQVLVLLLLVDQHDRLVVAFPALANPALLAITALLVVTALAAAGYSLIEEPARRTLRRRFAVPA